MRRWPWLLLAGLLAGCAGFQSRPIEPRRVEEGFRSRSLADPGLGSWVAEQLPSRHAPLQSSPLGLAELTLVALYYHPDLDVARARLEVAQASVITAGGRPNPTVGIGPRYNFDANPGQSPWTFNLTVDVPIETAGKRGYRIARAEHLGHAARLDLAEVAWRVRSRLRAALAEHLFALDEHALLDLEEGVRSELVAVMERRLAVGDVARIALEAARTDLAATRLASRAGVVGVVESRAALAAALGLPGVALDGAALEWPERNRPPVAGALAAAPVQRAGLTNRIDVRRGLAEYAAAEAALQLEVARQYPDVRLGSGYAWDQEANKFGIGLSITLPVLNRNEGPIAEAEARRREAAARFLALQAGVIGELDKALTRYQAVLAELQEADATLVRLDVRERTTRRSLEVGETDRAAVLVVRVERAAVARLRLGALRKAQAALGAIEDAVQQPLDAGIPFPEPSSLAPRSAREEVSR